MYILGMKKQSSTYKFLYICLLLSLLSCHNKTAQTTHYCENALYILSDSSANWHLNFDSLSTIEDFIRAKGKRLQKGDNKVLPYIKTQEGNKIMLGELRPPTGAGYFWDNKAIFRISYSKETCNIRWCRKKQEDSTNEEISKKITLNDLKEPILAFYQTNAYLKYQQDSLFGMPVRELRELEIFLIPEDEKTKDIIPYLEIIADAYLEYQHVEAKNKFHQNLCALEMHEIDSLKKALPLRVSILSKKR